MKGISDSMDLEKKMNGCNEKWKEEFKDFYPAKIAEGGVLICKFIKSHGKWSCKLDGKGFYAKTLRLGTERPIMASSLFVDEFGDLAMGGLGGSKVVCRADTKISKKSDEVMCILSGV